ncbi:Inactive N-acetylated-alpha-linked acidic dipeptidase-like protein 2 [Varanus komodoensis]|nr:Inactive N-acetylated-alpha-linked acidic dipeptidase-like protein 2 [Varanus komodoensis]
MLSMGSCQKLPSSWKIPFVNSVLLLLFLVRDLMQLHGKEDRDVAKKLLVQWTSYGLEDVQLVNYSVLLDLPSSSPNTVTLNNTGECFYASGQRCNKDTANLHSQDLLYSYAAYSAKGTLTDEAPENHIRGMFLKRICEQLQLSQSVELNGTPHGKHFADVEEVKAKTAEALKGIKINKFKTCFEQWKNVSMAVLHQLESTVKAEVIDVQYGTVEDLLRIQRIADVSRKIALLKLGHLPLLYKSITWLGFGLYIPSRTSQFIPEFEKTKFLEHPNTDTDTVETLRRKRSEIAEGKSASQVTEKVSKAEMSVSI